MMLNSLALLAGFTALLAGIAAAQSDTPPKVIEVPAFTVVGIDCRTNNAREASGQGCIGKQWARLFQEGILDKIPARVDRGIVAVYTNYTSDKDGEYTYILGAKVVDDAQAPAGMVKQTVAKGRFAVFTSDRGDVQQVVPATWKRIWAVPKSDPGGDRLYQSDFEIYDQRAADPKNAQMDIYIRIR
jgi:predicted transcriptional regulator YdeE